jgi:glycosyltransferase involved in cell wall biosynthesis
MNHATNAPASVVTSTPFPRISVCIAAYNEAGTIGRLLHQLSMAVDNGVVEILVCANGCTDGTESLVAQFADRDSRVRLILSAKGKPAAWNALMQEARSDIRLFLDADVRLAPDFFPALQQALRAHPGAAIIAARDLPKQERSGAGQFLSALASRAFGFDYVCGRAYALRLGIARRARAGSSQPVEPGCLEMPLQVLHEDFWLEVAIGLSLIAFAPAARVYYDPGTVNDLLKARTRLSVARRQVAGLLPDAFARWQNESILSRPFLPRLRSRLDTMDGPGDALMCTIGTATRSVLMALHKQQLRHMESRMIDQMERRGGHEVLAGSGRLSKSGRD